MPIPAQEPSSDDHRSVYFFAESVEVTVYDNDGNQVRVKKTHYQYIYKNPPLELTKPETISVDRDFPRWDSPLQFKSKVNEQTYILKRVEASFIKLYDGATYGLKS